MTLVPVISMILSGRGRDKLGHHTPRISGSQLLLPCTDQCCLKTLPALLNICLFIIYHRFDLVFIFLNGGVTLRSKQDVCISM